MRKQKEIDKIRLANTVEYEQILYNILQIKL